MKRTPQISMFYGALPDIFEKAKYLRENMTNAENVLWEYLSKNQLGARFKSQHPVSTFIVDFYCHQYKLVIEVDGEIHNEQTDYDNGRTAELERLGLKVVRFTNKEVLESTERTVLQIKTLLSTRKNELGL